MIPLVYGELLSEASSIYNVHRIDNVSKCVVLEEINGKYELKIIASIEYITVLKTRCIISVDVPYRDASYEELVRTTTKPQLFRIYRVLKDSTKKQITVYAKHISGDLNGVPVPSFSITVSNGTEKMIVENLNNAITATNDPEISNHFSISTLIDQSFMQFSLPYPKTIMSALLDKENSFISSFGGEILYEEKGTKIKIRERLGIDSNYKITYKVNLLGLSVEEYNSHTVIGILPYYYASKSDGQTESVTGNILFSDSEDENKGYRGYYIEPINVTSLVQQLYGTNWAEKDNDTKKAYVSNCGRRYKNDNPSVFKNVGYTTYKVNFVMLKDTMEYKDFSVLEGLMLGDGIQVYHPEIDVNVTVRCVAYEYDVLNERYRGITLSNARESISDTVFNLQKRLDRQNEEIQSLKK